jgi:hypothetical protein
VTNLTLAYISPRITNDKNKPPYPLKVESIKQCVYENTDKFINPGLRIYTYIPYEKNLVAKKHYLGLINPNLQCIFVE